MASELINKFGENQLELLGMCLCRSDKRSAIRHSKIPCQLLSPFYVGDDINNCINTQFCCCASIFKKMSDERTFFFLNLFRINKKIIVSNTLRYLLKIDLIIHARNIGRKMRDERTIKLLNAKDSNV
jgi:hypothetical protein